MIRCEDFERYLLDLHQGKISKELAAALEEHRRICKTCQELTPELIQIRQQLMAMVKLEPSPGFESRLARRIQEIEQPSKSWLSSLEENLAANWLAFGAGAVATVLIGFLLFSPQPPGALPGSSLTADNQTQESVVQPATNPELLTRGRENLPFGAMDDSTGQFYLTSEDTIPANQFYPQGWPSQVVSQQK